MRARRNLAMWEPQVACPRITRVCRRNPNGTVSSTALGNPVAGLADAQRLLALRGGAGWCRRVGRPPGGDRGPSRQQRRAVVGGVPDLVHESVREHLGQNGNQFSGQLAAEALNNPTAPVRSVDRAGFTSFTRWRAKSTPRKNSCRPIVFGIDQRYPAAFGLPAPSSMPDQRQAAAPTKVRKCQQL